MLCFKYEETINNLLVKCIFTNLISIELMTCLNIYENLESETFNPNLKILYNIFFNYEEYPTFVRWGVWIHISFVLLEYPAKT